MLVYELTKSIVEKKCSELNELRAKKIALSKELESCTSKEKEILEFLEKQKRDIPYYVAHMSPSFYSGRHDELCNIIQSVLDGDASGRMPEPKADCGPAGKPLLSEKEGFRFLDMFFNNDDPVEKAEKEAEGRAGDETGLANPDQGRDLKEQPFEVKAGQVLDRFENFRQLLYYIKLYKGLKTLDDVGRLLDVKRSVYKPWIDMLVPPGRDKNELAERIEKLTDGTVSRTEAIFAMSSGKNGIPMSKTIDEYKKRKAELPADNTLLGGLDDAMLYDAPRFIVCHLNHDKGMKYTEMEKVLGVNRTYLSQWAHEQKIAEPPFSDSFVHAVVSSGFFNLAEDDVRKGLAAMNARVAQQLDNAETIAACILRRWSGCTDPSAPAF